MYPVHPDTFPAGNKRSQDKSNTPVHREKLLATGTDTDHFGNVFRLQRQIQELLPGSSIRRFHLGNQLKLETGLISLPLRNQQTAVHLFQIGIFRMLFQ